MRKILLSVVVLSLIFSGCSARFMKLEQQGTSNTIPAPVSIRTYSISQSVVTPIETTEDSKVDVKEGESALDVLKRTHTVELKHYDFGDVADSIDGTVGGKDGRYWIFYVNGKMSQVGAGEYKIQPDDKIIWKYQKENEGL